MTKRIESDSHVLAEFALKTIHDLSIDSAEIHFSQQKGFSLTARLGEVETISHHRDNAFSVTVYHDHCTGSASSADFSKDAIQKTIEKASTIARYGNPDPYAGLPDAKRLAKTFPDCQLYYPWEITPTEAIALAVECERLACDYDSRITNSEGVDVSTLTSTIVSANTLGFMGTYALSEHAISCSVVAKDNDHMQRDHEYTIARNPAQLRSIDWVAKQAAQKTIQRLNPKRLKTQTCPVVYIAPLAKSLLGAFVQAVSGPNLYRQSSFLLNALDQSIFPAFVDIVQEPHLLGAMGSAPFDQDGVLTQNQSYVHQGRLANYILGSYSARKLGMESTGNAGGVFNLTISHTDDSLDALLKKMNRGLLITDLLGQGVNITTGDYSRGAAGFWIEEGKIQYPVEEITVAGNLKNMFQQIVAIGADRDERGSIRTGSILVDGVTVAGH